MGDASMVAIEKDRSDPLFFDDLHRKSQAEPSSADDGHRKVGVDLGTGFIWARDSDWNDGALPNRGLVAEAFDDSAYLKEGSRTLESLEVERFPREGGQIKMPVECHQRIDEEGAALRALIAMVVSEMSLQGR